MKYPTGKDVRIWDRVRGGSNWRGIVVFSVDTDEYSPRFPREQWAYLGRGVMIDTTDAGLVHHPEESCFELAHRGEAPSPDEWAELRHSQLSRQGEWKSGGGPSVQVGYVNPNDQICLGHRGVPGTDDMHLAYRVECARCGHVYGANGSDMHERRCPACDQGAAGIPY